MWLDSDLVLTPFGCHWSIPEYSHVHQFPCCGYVVWFIQSSYVYNIITIKCSCNYVLKLAVAVQANCDACNGCKTLIGVYGMQGWMHPN